MHLRRLFLAFAAATAVLAPCLDARAEEPTRVIEVDPDAYPPPSTRVPLLLTGAAVTGVFYGAAVGASYFWPDARGAEDLRIPVVGPWMKLFQTGCSGTGSCNHFWLAVGAVLAGLDGLGQAGGVGLMLEAVFLQTRQPVASFGSTDWGVGFAGAVRRSDAKSAGGFASTPRASVLEPRSSITWYPVPFTAGDDGVGLGVAGMF